MYLSMYTGRGGEGARLARKWPAEQNTIYLDELFKRLQIEIPEIETFDLFGLH